MRKLALDLGTKTCGFAITDADIDIALGLETIHFAENEFDSVIKQIEFYDQKYSNISVLVIGLPMRSNGDWSERTHMCFQFAQRLKQHFNKAIYTVNEYGSTIKAQQSLRQANIKRKKVKQVKDTMSAMIILNEFLEYGGSLVE